MVFGNQIYIEMQCKIKIEIEYCKRLASLEMCSLVDNRKTCHRERMDTTILTTLQHIVSRLSEFTPSHENNSSESFNK